MVAAVTDSLEFERKYTSVVIAWAPDDRPTDEQIEAVLDEFEKTAWAGLKPDRYRGAGPSRRGCRSGARAMWSRRNMSRHTRYRSPPRATNERSSVMVLPLVDHGRRSQSG